MKKRLYSVIAFIMICVIVISNCKIYSFADGQGSANVVRSGDNVVITYDGNWDYWINNSFSVYGSVPAGMESIVISQDCKSESGSVNVLNAWYSGIDGASGNYSCSEPDGDIFGHIHFELIVPISAFGDTDSLAIGYNGQTFEIEMDSDDDDPEITPEETPEVTPEITPEVTPEVTPEITPEITPEVTPEVTPEITPEVTPKITPAVQPEEPNISVSSDIEIDGYYNDWVDLPGADMSYHSTNDTTHHIAQIYCDGEYVYIHFKTADNYKSHMPFSPIDLYVNGSSNAIQLAVWKNQNYATPSNGKGTQTGLAIRINSNWGSDASASYTIYDENLYNGKKHEGEEMEMAISLSDIEQVTGIKAESIQQLTVKNVNLGDQSATWAGTPTGPIAGGVAMAGLAGIGFISFRRKRVR